MHTAAMTARDAIEELEEPRLKRHRIGVLDYYKLAEVGVLAREARVELIEGEVIDMAPTGTRHHSTVMRLNQMLQTLAGPRATVLVQASMRLDEFNQPEPDLALLKPRDDFYAHALPTGRDALLVIEVADSTLAYDVRTKAPLYARSGVPEYWVIDLLNGQLRRFAHPEGDTWAIRTAEERPAGAELPGLGGVRIELGAVW